MGIRPSASRRVNPYDCEQLWTGYHQPSENETIRIELLRSLVPADARRLLDLGCGIGSVSNGLEGDLVVGADITRVALQQSVKERVLADATMLPFVEGAFEVVIAAEMFEHLTDNDHAEAAAEVIRLKPNTIIVSVPFREDLEIVSSLCKKCGIYFNAYHHCRSYEPSDLDSLFRGYDRTMIRIISPVTSPSKWVVKLGRRFNYYTVLDGEVCSECGSEVERPPMIVRLLFGGITQLSLRVNQMLGRTRLYHMIARYEAT